MSKAKLRITYNAPVVLTFAIICVVLFIINALTKDWLNGALLVCYGHPNPMNVLTYVRCITYVFGHGSLSHLTSNMIFLLLVGPIAEEKYGSWNIFIMMLITAAIGGIINSIFFSTGILGASGIVFLMIILSAFTNMKKGEIPVSLILVTAVYLGQEIYDWIFVTDNVSHVGHLLGGASGLGFGALYHKKLFDR